MLEKESILHYSRQKFLAEGIARVRMDDIAKDLRISKKTLYKYFPSKTDLIHDAIFDMIESAKKTFTEIIEGQGDAISKLERIGKVFFGLAKNFSDKWLNDIRIYHQPLWLEIDNFRSRVIEENFSKIIEQGKKEGVFIDRPSPIILSVFLGAIRNVINPDFLMNNNFSFQNAAQITLDMLFTGLLTKQGRKAYKQIKSESMI